MNDNWIVIMGILCLTIFLILLSIEATIYNLAALEIKEENHAQSQK